MTTEEEFEQVSERAYESVTQDELDNVQTKTELASLLERKFFKERAYAKLTPEVVRIFEKKDWWQPPKVEHVPFEPVEKVPTEERKKVTIDTEEIPIIKKKQRIRVRKPKVIKENTDEDIEMYIKSKPREKKEGKEYIITKKKKAITEESYRKKIANLRKGWFHKRKKGVTT